MKLPAAIVLFALMLGACGATAGSSAPSSTTAQTTPAISPATPTAPSTTTGPSTAPAPSDSTLDDGRPSTFLAITFDYRAVEVDTLTGEVVRVVGQTAAADDFASTDEIYPNALDAIWRLADRSATLVSECCEPASGAIYLLESDQQITGDTRGDLTYHAGWWASPAPMGSRFALLNEMMVVSAPGRTEPLYSAWLNDIFGTWAVSNATWNREGDTVYWIGQDDDAGFINGVSLEADEPDELSTPLDIVRSGVWFGGLATQANGNLVAFAHEIVGPCETTESRGIVFTPAGTVVAEFPVEIDSTLGGYDPSGRFLIYVDGAGAVRWPGVGQSGVLGDG